MKTHTNPNGTTLTVIEGEGNCPTLKELQAMVGGMIEIVTIKTDQVVPVGSQLIVNEEGLIHGLDFNPLATQVYWSTCRPGTTHPIVGNAVVLQNGAQCT